MRENQKRELFENLVDSCGFYEENAVFLKSMYTELSLDVKSLYVLYSVLKNQREISCYCGEVEVIPNGDKVEMTYKSKTLSFNSDDIRFLVGQTITICEDILPQGTLVELDLGKIKVPNPNSTQLFVVITKRFLGDETGPFYQYGGELYPTGNYGTGKTLSFTPATIKEVVHKGYESELDNQFVYEILDELLVKEHRISMGFAKNQGA
ncbi:MAG: DUF4176 domain-containing protein [Pseudobutyrivibrio sp.]|nr:DUF4176 domain-containing protein [Pseudobutyrivibrio sp.]